MSQILVKETVPGAAAAQSIMGKLANVGIHDVKLMYDKDILPNGMWAVVQIQGRTSSLLLPESYDATNLQPYILWWVKNNEGRFREPNDEDLMNIITVVKRAPKIWEQGEKRADHFDELDAKKDQAHQQRFKDRIHDIAPAMKKALRKGNL